MRGLESLSTRVHNPSRSILQLPWIHNIVPDYPEETIQQSLSQGIEMTQFSSIRFDLSGHLVVVFEHKICRHHVLRLSGNDSLDSEGLSHDHHVKAFGRIPWWATADLAGLACRWAYLGMNITPLSCVSFLTSIYTAAAGGWSHHLSRVYTKHLFSRYSVRPSSWCLFISLYVHSFFQRMAHIRYFGLRQYLFSNNQDYFSSPQYQNNETLIFWVRTSHLLWYFWQCTISCQFGLLPTLVWIGKLFS